MKNNQPVTTVETQLPEGEFIYSRTDLSSLIVVANEAFARVSGYLQSEMLGQPHNLVRHPDMPPEAFADMWRDLKAGRPWRGLVKNRRKDGGFYWVVANASPVREHGRVVGYQSIRTRPSREEIAAADAAYKRLRAGDKSIRIQHGQVVATHGKLWHLLTSCEFHAMASGGLALLLALSVAAQAGLGFTSLQSANLVLALLTALSSLLFIGYALPSMRRALAMIEQHLEYVLASGDLTRRTSSARPDLVGRLSRALDVLLSSTQATMQGIGDAAKQVESSTLQVAASVQQVNASASVQGSATSAAAAAVEQVTVAIGEVAAHARSTREAAERSGVAASKGAAQSSVASQTVLSLVDTVRTAASQVDELGKRSIEISKITNTIKEIADQTNLLALNAAIEAARAGETGRGFAVVADEVRKLAERTGSATRDISQMVTAIRIETERAVAGIRAGSEQVEASVQLVDSSRLALDGINQEMSNTSVMVSEITHATAEQQNAMSELSVNINRVAEMTEQNLQVVSHADDLARQLNGSVERMLYSIGQYTV